VGISAALKNVYKGAGSGNFRALKGVYKAPASFTDNPTNMGEEVFVCVRGPIMIQVVTWRVVRGRWRPISKIRDSDIPTIFTSFSKVEEVAEVSWSMFGPMEKL
jgi:hypothetical protein